MGQDGRQDKGKRVVAGPAQVGDQVGNERPGEEKNNDAGHAEGENADKGSQGNDTQIVQENKGGQTGAKTLHLGDIIDNTGVAQLSLYADRQRIEIGQNSAQEQASQ